jgi:hypothetical protein
VSTSSQAGNEGGIRNATCEEREHVRGGTEPGDSFVSLGEVAKRVADKARNGGSQSESEGRDNMLEVHGVVDAKKIMMVGETDNVPVKIVDRPNQKIEIVIGSTGASLTVEQAEFIATQLRNAIRRATGKAG